VQRLNRRVATLIALAVLMTVGLTACGDDDEDTEAGQTTETTAPAPRGSDTVTIEMTDYAYTVSGPLNAGGTLRISNTGKEFHMIAMGRFKPGKTMQDLQTALQQMASEGGPGGGGGGGETTTTTASGATTTTARGGTTTTARGGTTTTAAGGGEAGGGQQDPTAEILDQIGLPGTVMSPAESAEVTVPNLTPGTYALLCFIPTEAEGPPHIAKGMVGELEVVAGPTPPQPTADATYRVSAGQPIQGPATLTPGRHTLRFEAAPGAEQLEPIVARLNSGTTFAQLESAFERLFEGENPPPRGAATQAPGQVVFGGFDLQDVTSFYLTVDLKAGNYVIAAPDTDPEDPPPTPREIINIRVA
jgi:hypothetical protein